MKNNFKTIFLFTLLAFVFSCSQGEKKDNTNEKEKDPIQDKPIIRSDRCIGNKSDQDPGHL